MKVSLMVVGKSTPDFIVTGVKEYTKRLKHYISFNYLELPPGKGSKDSSSTKKKEAETILKKLQVSDTVILLDEKGKQFRSVDFAKYINNHMVRSTQHLVFIVGGAFGFDQSIYDRANHRISLGKGTMSHQLIRIVFLEQLYRAFTIIRGEKYHNE